MYFWWIRIHESLGPFKGMCSLIVGSDETVNGFPELFGRGEACPFQGVSCQKRKPYLDLVQPAGMGRDEMKVNVLVAGKPEIPLWLVRAEIIHNDVDFSVRMRANNTIHEIKELHPLPPLVVPGDDLAGSRLQRSEKGGSTVPLILVGEASHRSAVGQPEVPLGALKSLDMGFLIDAENERILRWVKVQSHNIDGFLGELRIGAYTPTPPPLELNTPISPKKP